MNAPHAKNGSPGRNAASVWTKTVTYAGVSLLSFLCGVGLLSLMLWNAERLVALGLTGNLYYIVLLPLALCVAAFLFGVLQSTASFRGKHLGGALELGGPIVASALVVIGGFWLVPNVAAFPLTVYIHGERGPDNIVLRNSGTVVVDLGPDRRREAIGDKGQAYFPGIPASFRGKSVRVWVESDQYELIETIRERSISDGTLYLPVKRRSGRLSGHVQDRQGNPIGDAEISVGNLSVRTNRMGYFEMPIPGDQLRDKLDVTFRAEHHGSQRYEMTPNANPAVIVLERQ